MSGQDVFKGALGWDDWIWWTGIGGLALFFCLTLLCCCVCVQRAKRKGRQEALAAVQARQREEQQREEAQVRYAQAQQARYPAPAQEQNYKYSQQQGGAAAGAPAPAQFVPAGGPKKNYGPQVMANAGYAAPPPMPPHQYAQQQQQYGQQQYGQQQQQYGQAQQQQYAAIPKKQQYAPQQQQQNQAYYQQQQQHQNVTPPQYAQPPPPAPQQKVYDHEPQEHQKPYVKPTPQDYQRKTYAKPKPWHTPATTAAPYVADDVSFSSNYSDEANRSLHEHDVPFVAVTSPTGRDPSLNASGVSKMTLRDRIDALREGSVHENHTRISVDPQDLELPPIGAGRRSLVLAGTVLSEQSPSSASSTSSSGKSAAKQTAAYDQAAFKTARSMDDSVDSAASSAAVSRPFSTGQFSDAESSSNYKNSGSSAVRDRLKSDGSSTSRGSVEF